MKMVLGIESTCDETACAVVYEGREILSNIVASQNDLHEQYGGVFPELACRRHVDVLIPIVEEALRQAEVKPAEIDLVSVAKGPGLIGALLVGINGAKGLAYGWNKPLIGINHVEAHLYAAMMDHDPIFPSIGVVISGGHTFLVKILTIGSYELIGSTVDDSVGEVFDKVASMLDLPYPGGPQIEALAKQAVSTSFKFHAGKVKERPWDFSFSGLKTNVMYTLKGANSKKNDPLIIAEEQKKEIAKAFQDTALFEIVSKTVKAANAFDCKAIYVGGGVSQNRRLRELFEKECSIPVFYPGKGLSTDNAAMIAGLAYHQFQKNPNSDLYELEPMHRIPFEEVARVLD